MGRRVLKEVMRVTASTEVKNASKELIWLKKRAEWHLKKLTKTRVPAAKYLLQVELSLVLTSDRKIRRINYKWRGKDKATDVLSFPQWEPGDLKKIMAPGFCLGDIIISLETARQQAKELGHGLRQELDRLLVHGLLHLLGYDHEVGPKEARRMRSLEKKLLTR